MQKKILQLLVTLAMATTAFAEGCKVGGWYGTCDYGGHTYDCDSSGHCPYDGRPCGVDRPDLYPYADCVHWGES
ncbi:unnamed protein product [Zymoseptoria tritici ST99CH_3D7]|uniref:Chitin-binding type-1 domain-containing protein n=2 Tax=Zymoseptoria tritici TaxID=1047171 RepID=A0A1X7RVR7_ZYMT9|nr:unnamed protein product [Zymoseptoria tritici ST99CH_3D7]SMR53646.1 unnamed protein product [Zymoseptoria tritici ST99CH_1E4]